LKIETEITPETIFALGDDFCKFNNDLQYETYIFLYTVLKTTAAACADSEMENHLLMSATVEVLKKLETFNRRDKGHDK
jgi:hypothetical protein